VVVWLWRHDRRLRRSLAITLGVAVGALSIAGWTWRESVVARLGVGPLPGEASTPVPSAMLGHLLHDERVTLNAAALRTIAAHPLLGVGAGNSPLAMPREGAAPHYPHNVPLMLATEVGVAGALLWWSLLGVAVWRWRQSIGSPAAGWIVATVGAFVALQIISLLDCYPWSLNPGRMLTVAVLAMIELAARQTRT
ncbi:MAG: O-antigen ligase family protein, partial [Candidatus Binatia bacterium]